MFQLTGMGNDSHCHVTAFLQSAALGAHQTSHHTLTMLCFYSCLFLIAECQITIWNDIAGWCYDALVLFCVNTKGRWREGFITATLWEDEGQAVLLHQTYNDTDHADHKSCDWSVSRYSWFISCYLLRTNSKGYWSPQIWAFVWLSVTALQRHKDGSI